MVVVKSLSVCSLFVDVFVDDVDDMDEDKDDNEGLRRSYWLMLLLLLLIEKAESLE